MNLGVLALGQDMDRPSTSAPNCQPPSRMLGIHISVAAAWQRASAGDWSNDADVARRGITGTNEI